MEVKEGGTAGEVGVPESQGRALPGPVAGQARLLALEPSLPADRQSHRPGRARRCLLGEGGWSLCNL